LAPRLSGDPPDAAAALRPTTPPTTLVGFAAPFGERTTGPLCWMVVVDESSSMATADTTGARADAVRAAARFIASHGLDEDRIGATWFADQAEVLPPGDPATVRIAPTGGVPLGSSTRMAAALRSALDAMASACGSARQVLVLVSDGAASGEDEFAGTKAVLAAAPAVDVYLIAMNGGSAFEPSRAFWADPALGVNSIRTIDTFGADEVAGAMAAVLSIATGQEVVAS
jgi:hypothetical protein